MKENKIPLLCIKNLKVTFPPDFCAVRGVDLRVFEGQSVGIVGESGCGKTTLAHAITRLIDNARVEGKIQFAGEDLTEKGFLGKKIGMVFQSPMTSLNPTMRIGKQISEGMVYHRIASRNEAKRRTLELLDLVGIDHPELRVKQYPHELSGGQRQRVMIAIALSCNPRLLIADEPTTALDVTVQAQVIRLIKELREKLNMSLLLISHDLGVVSRLCEQMIVFYAGKIVEQGPTRQILQSPKHPYTQMLIGSRPSNLQGAS